MPQIDSRVLVTARRPRREGHGEKVTALVRIPLDGMEVRRSDVQPLDWPSNRWTMCPPLDHTSTPLDRLSESGLCVHASDCRSGQCDMCHSALSSWISQRNCGTVRIAPASADAVVLARGAGTGCHSYSPLSKRPMKACTKASSTSSPRWSALRLPRCWPQPVSERRTKKSRKPAV